MAEVAQTMETADRSFFWRRLHSLTGIIPIGGFLLFHIFENLKAVTGEVQYNEGISSIAHMLPKPWLLAVELGVLALPILFHGLYGMYIVFNGKPNAGAYPYRQNQYYLIQRITGVLALLFIAFHVIGLRVLVTLMGTGSGGVGAAAMLPKGYVTYMDVKHVLENNVVFVGYLIGAVASAFHLGNGLNGFCWTWGLAINEKSRKAVEVIGWLLTLALSAALIHILISFRY